MKKNYLFLFTIMFFSFIFCGCTKKEKTLKELEDAYIEKPYMTLTKSDTTEVLSLVNRYLDCLRQGYFDDAVSMLYFLNNDSVIALPKKLAEENIAIQNRFRGVRYELESLKFSEETDNMVRYKVTLFDRKAGDTTPNEVRYSLRPVRRDGNWFLTVLDSQTSPDGIGTKINY